MECYILFGGERHSITVNGRMQSQLFSSTLNGIESLAVRVEVAVSNGLPGLTMVGLPDAAVSEAGARVRSALRAIEVALPPRRLVVNLSPGDLRKHGAGFDLALAVGLMASLGEVPSDGLEETMVVGELSLDGSVRAVKGAISTLGLALSDGRVKRLMLPACQLSSLPEFSGVELLPVEHLSQARAYLRGEACPEEGVGEWERSQGKTSIVTRNLAEVVGQPMGRWALEVSAAGGHHLMMVGPPGCGKSFLASCLPGLLPPLSEEEWWEVASIASACGEDTPGRERPFRAPGPGTTPVALLGGYSPGEVTRAHCGVLFLDEFPEFRRDSLESLRQVMEEGVVNLVRAKFRTRYPARFTLVAAMNPCPCGFAGLETGGCCCQPGQLLRYSNRFSGPMRDRFDLMVHLERAGLQAYLEAPKEEREGTETVRDRVHRARARQAARGTLNRELRGSFLRGHLNLTSADEAFCTEVGERLKLSVRGLEKWLRVARTLADLRGEERVSRTQLTQALSLRDGG